MDPSSLFYKTPSTEILRHRREFYGLWKRCDDQIGTWLDRVQNQIDRCEFPSVLSCEYLLIDKLVCELNDDERAFIQSANTWTLLDLKSYLKVRKMDTDHRVNANISTSKLTDQNVKMQAASTSSSSSLLVAVRSEPVNDEYSKSIARKGIANQLNPMMEIKDEPVPIVYEDLSTANFSIDTANGCASLAEGEKPKVDIINDMPIDGMDFECEDYKFSIKTVIDTDEDDDGDEDDKSNQSAVDPPVKKAATKQKNASRNRNGRFECDQCDKFYLRLDRLKTHKKAAHDKILPFICDICDRRFTHFSFIKNHMVIHMVKAFSCDICKKFFSTKNAAITHKLEVHDKIRLFACNQCDKSYARKTWLTLHKQFAHYGIKSYECKVCDLRFNQRIDLKHHLRTHGCENQTTEKLFACSKCNKSYTRISYLENHKKNVHDRIRPYVCDVCNRNFINYHLIKSHMITHTGAKPFACDQCNKVYSQSASLWQHKKSIHQGIRPFACTDCDKSFRSTYELRRHLVIHK